jgi:hypothetical protein
MSTEPPGEIDATIHCFWFAWHAMHGEEAVQSLRGVEAPASPQSTP